MINTLHIKNIGIIEDLTINLNEGFNVLTGETGAGKTLIIGSLGILAGERFSKDMIRNGEKNSFVEMSVYFPNHGYEEDNVIVSREINLSGKNICKINGRLVTVNELKDFMKKVIDIHGQNDNQSILDVSTHINLIDNFSINKLSKIKSEYQKYYYEYLDIKKELCENYGDDKEKQRKLDLLKYQIDEIENANLKLGEEEELNEKHKLIMSSEKIFTNLEDAYLNLNESTISNLESAIKSLERISGFDNKIENFLERLRESYYEIEEAERDIEIYKSNIDFNEELQEEVEERLDLINSLKRKYGNNIQEILDYKESIKKEIFEIENLEDYIKSLKSKKAELEKEMSKLAQNMHEVRIESAYELSNQINKELKELEMKNAKFTVSIESLEENKFNLNGLDKVEFMIITNTGEKEKPLIKIASGGEMSRIMLAIKTVLADVDEIPVLIFDEIDTGISGIAANATGEKMKRISKNHQVICVTHLASIAAKGDYNYFISKEVKEEKTFTSIELLDEENTLKEIARIASGNITEISLSHAKELREGVLKEKVS